MKKIKRHVKNFTKYLIIGILWSLLNVVFMWLLIDVIKFTALIGSTIALVILVVSKYYAYVLIKLINKNFLKYLSTVISFTIANIFFMWLAVDIMKFPTVIVSSVIVFIFFLLRFVIFNLIGLVEK